MKIENQNNNQMNAIVLTKEQFLSLAKVVYLGNWMANAHGVDSTDIPRKKEYDEIQDYIFNQAKKFGFGDKLEHELEYDPEWIKTHDSLSPLGAVIDEYNEEMFWDELVDRLGKRDFEMGKSKDREDLYENIEKWDVEMCDFGLSRIIVNKDIKL